MSFLTPLYLLAGLAVGLPILFHLIRRTPRGRQDFSSLMFLVPSPPRVTKRSRIEDWLLLILRGLVVCLLALAFSRPFWRAHADTETAGAEGRRWAILVDTSASMRRTGLWEEAVTRLRETLREVRVEDVVSVSLFDRNVRPLVTSEEWAQHPAADRVRFVEERLKESSPGWFSTSLATAIMGAAEELDDQTEKHLSERTVIVISDLQSGSEWEALRGYSWPEAVSVKLEPVGTGSGRTNATLRPVQGDETVDGRLRLRVSNSADAERETFRIFGYSGTGGTGEPRAGEPFVGSELTVYVPPGQSRVVKAPEEDRQSAEERAESAGPSTAKTAWALAGDDEEFDNTCYVSPGEPWNVRIVYHGADDPADPDGLRFFLGPAFPSSPSRQVEIVGWGDPLKSGGRAGTNAAADTADAGMLQAATMLVVGGEVPAGQIAPIHEWIDAGGLVLFVARSAEQASQLYELAGSAPEPVEEAAIDRYAMVSAVDFDHPVLAPFDDPRYSDFTRLRIWKHRNLNLDRLPGAHALIRFDDGYPALAEIPVGEGRIFALATGWNRGDSELALWSKFVPLLNVLLEYGGRQPDPRQFFTTGESIVPAVEENGRFHVVNGSHGESTPATAEAQLQGVVRLPDGTIVTFSPARPLLLNQPGLYAAAGNEAELSSESVRFAVNLPAEESRTDPLSKELLEATGVQMVAAAGSASKAAAELRERQLMNKELEAQQQYWRWLLVAALVVLLVESTVSGRIARKRLAESSS